MLAQTSISFSCFKAAVYHFFKIFKEKALTLLDSLCPLMHLLFTIQPTAGWLQSGFCSQHSVKSAIMMKVTKEFPIPKPNEYYFI